jgi:cellulose synthase/poly-beta-1,6-N-acetylglucosamine synthase-like glycosyltransferase
VTEAIWSPGWFVVAFIIAFGALAAAAAMYLLVLAIAAFAYREPEFGVDPSSRLVVLVPAHNEADLIQRCVASLRNQDYPPDRFQIIVVADNCTDDTEGLARAAGVDVLVREAPEARGKGQALRWGMDRVLARLEPPDAFVVIDADSVADRGLLSGLVAYLERGAEAVQAEYLVLDDLASPRVQLRAVAFLLFHRVRFAGRAALHLPCNLVGNGMLLSRTLMERHPWNAFTGAEDLEYSLTLRLEGVLPVFAGSALVRGPVPASRRSAQVQRERWEGGRLHAVRRALPRLLRAILVQRRISLVDAAVDLLVPPLGLLAVGALAGVVLVLALWSAGLVSLWLLTPWLISLGAITGFVTVGLRAAKAPAWMYRRLISTPAFLVQKLLGTVSVVRSHAAHKWIRTERPSEIAS